MDPKTAKPCSDEIQPNQPGKRNAVHIVYGWIESLITSLIAAVLVFTLFFRIVAVSGPSMLPTVRSGDRVILSGFAYHPHRNDVVVITHTAKVTEPIIKRVIALENEVVDIDFQTGTILINGIPLKESAYLRKGIVGQNSDYRYPLKVPKGHVFVLGDNRAISNDSRFQDIGMIDQQFILGKAQFIVFPFDRVGKIK
ncbi:MAG TPA: signal peptidase I [Caproiciproducens sp.]|nr:signal peptidase I [Caproiciproducens sp.]